MAVSSGLAGALTAGRQLVLTASPGAGKTTIVPLLVAQVLGEKGGGGALGKTVREAGKLETDGQPETGGQAEPAQAEPAQAETAGQKIIVAQPRRVAVRSAARYVASLLGEKVGQTVGWRMRGDTQTSSQTRIEFTTTGTLLRRLLAEPDLPGVNAVILDEIHERHLDADLALALTLDIAALREDLTVIAMSATADADRFAHLITTALGTPTPIINATQPPHPLEISWAPPREHALNARGLTGEFLTHLTNLAQQALQTHGSTLVFVDTIANAEKVSETLRSRGLNAFALHSQVPAATQDQILTAAAQPRVIVATEIAETSLTVPGVHCVVDSGVSRSPRFDPTRQATHLVTVSASQSALTQRAGRANRTGPGIVYRAFSQTDYARAKAYAPAEILGADLTEATLLAYAWSAPEQLALLDAFPVPARQRAETNLLQIGALEQNGNRIRITAAGRVLAQIPADPRLAHGMLCAAAWGIPAQRAAAVGAEADPRQQARLTQLVSQFVGEYQRFLAPSGISLAEDAAEAIVWGAAHPQWIARASGENAKLGVTRFTSVSGAGFEVEAGTELAGSKWIVAGEIQGINGVLKVRAGAPVSEPLALQLAAFTRREMRETALENGRVQAWQTSYLGALPLARSKTAVSTAELYELLTGQLLAAQAKDGEWLELFSASSAARQFVYANNYLAARDLRFPVIDNTFIAADLELFLGASTVELCSGAALATVDVLTGVKLLLGWQLAEQVTTLIPPRVRVPSGREVPVTIDPARGPTISLKLQECFGWRQVPQVLGKQLSLELLSPAGRPLAVTGDLAHFFDCVYASVRAEMRGRYPKHPWPENPWEAVATVKTKRALGE